METFLGLQNENEMRNSYRIWEETSLRRDL